jgi:hypothetical protein
MHTEGDEEKTKDSNKKKGVLYIHGEKRFLTLSFFFTAVVELNRKQKKG